jgi:hypothetical protein
MRGRDLPLTWKARRRRRHHRVLELTKPSRASASPTSMKTGALAAARFLGAGGPEYDYSDAELAFLLAHDSDPSTAGKPASAWPCAAC